MYRYKAAVCIYIPSDSSGFIEAQSIIRLRKSTRRVSREPYRGLVKK
ncbi:MAG: hypothetical protein LBF66_00435 [Holosporales bacterium]|nr:hypothetical protein [Holosporales bacterium]